MSNERATHIYFILTNNIWFVRSEVLMVVCMKITVFWYVASNLDDSNIQQMTQKKTVIIWKYIYMQDLRISEWWL
jgi:hypothetical protein